MRVPLRAGAARRRRSARSVGGGLSSRRMAGEGGSITAPARIPARPCLRVASFSPGVGGSSLAWLARGYHRTVLIVVLALAAAVLLALAIFGAARWWGYEPSWVARARHATGEAGWRTSAAWAEFTDWLRLGR